mgnify:CR=1 FL=1
MNDWNEEKLRQLVQLRGRRDRIISVSDEERMLEEAVTRLDIPLHLARGIMLAAADAEGIEVESDIERATAAMIVAFGRKSRSISARDFETVAKFHAGRTNGSAEDSRKVVKRLARREGVAPQRDGILLSTRWYRRIE